MLKNSRNKEKEELYKANDRHQQRNKTNYEIKTSEK